MITPKSKAGQLLLHMQKGLSVNRSTAVFLFGIYNLQRQVAKLEKSGFKIGRHWIKDPSNSELKIYEYSLEESQLAQAKDVQHEAVA